MMDDKKNDKKCPICDEAVRSDANIREFCKLCGMGIPNPSDKPKCKTGEGETIYFCCEKCQSTYSENTINNGEC